MNEPAPDPKTTLRLTLMLCLTAIFGGSTLVVQYNAQQYLLQTRCMDIHGNWESRHGGNDGPGCRFPVANEEKKK